VLKALRFHILGSKLKGSRIRVLIERCANCDHGRAYARSLPVVRMDLRSTIIYFN